ncbi:MAG TPA: tetratricopeptide repeat protein, partial [Alphaproteobacteria bacterium]
GFQIGMLIHAIRTRREQTWIYLLVLVPGVGSVAYFAAEFVPWLMSSPDARRAAGKLTKALDPERDLRRYAAEARLSDSVSSKLKLAEELAANKRFDEAIAAYRGCLSGIFAHEPKIMLAVASVEFEKGDHAAAAATLEALAKANPEFRSAEGHLLYARALEGSGRLEEALGEYRALSEYYPGAEARARYGLLLKRTGDAEGAHRAFKDVLDGAELAPRHVRRHNAEWIDLARRESGAQG